MRALALLLAMVPGIALPGWAGVPEPEGYRGEPYRAEVPATLKGAEVIGDAAARALWVSGAVAFVDALPRAPKPDLPAGTIWHEPPHETIPGAVWLPNTGYEALAEESSQYLRDGLETVTGGDMAAPVVVFCKRECWMSWNVGKRAMELGYSRVFWYPDGVDGWAEQGWTLEAVEPFQPAS